MVNIADIGLIANDVVASIVIRFGPGALNQDPVGELKSQDRLSWPLFRGRNSISYFLKLQSRDFS